MDNDQYHEELPLALFELHARKLRLSKSKSEQKDVSSPIKQELYDGGVARLCPISLMCKIIVIMQLARLFRQAR